MGRRAGIWFLGGLLWQSGPSAPTVRSGAYQSSPLAHASTSGHALPSTVTGNMTPSSN